MVDLVTFGHLTLDDLVLENDSVLRDTLGGGALFSAVGARLWGPAVGIHACVGADYPAAYRRRIEAQGLDITGISVGPARGLRLWLLMEGELRKQQLPTLASGRIEELEAMREPLPTTYHAARGFHFAPALPAAQADAIRAVRRVAPAAIVTLDIWTEPFFDQRAYLAPGFLAGVDAFLPSDKEVEALWGLDDLTGTLRRLAAQGPRVVAVKRGGEGSLVYDRGRQTLWHVPAVPVAVVDTTGAGDAYAGGFLVGLVETDDPVEAALRGTVSASFAVQHHGALAGVAQGAPPDPAEVHRRLATLRHRVREEGSAP